jgi:predicted transport protein
MNTILENKRSKLVAELSTIPSHMQQCIQKLKTDGEKFRIRPDLLWYLLLQSAATHGNSRGWEGLCGDPVTLNSVSYSKLVPLDAKAREVQILAALRKAKVRMPTIKAPQLASNVARIASMGGVEQASKRMLNLTTRDEKFHFMLQFDGIGEKYGRNVWMDIYDPTFRNTVAVDQRLKKVARVLGFKGSSYQQTETFYCDIAKDAGIEPWELDRLLYNFTDHFLNVIGFSENHEINAVLKSNCFIGATGGNAMRRAESDNNSITGLSSEMPLFTPEFKRVYGRDPMIQGMFVDLVSRFFTYPIRRYTTHYPDYRMQKNSVFCCIRLQRKCLFIILKVDGHHLKSNTLKFEEYKDASKSGKIPYVNFRVTDGNQTDEAFQLIEEAYKINV